MQRTAAAFSAILLLGSAPAFAGSLSYSNFTSTSGLNLTGNASVSSSGALILTPQMQYAAGAALTSTALSLGTDPNFATTFQFSIDTTGGSAQSANGFAFVLTSDATGVGTANQMLGLTSAPSLAVEFSDYGNHNLNPAIGHGLYNSNLVAAIQNGDTMVAGNSTSSYGSPGPTSCINPGSGVNCMNNDTVWTANISYQNGLLTVTMQDGTNAATTVINNYAIALADSAFIGFSGSTGSFYQSVNILNWTLNYNNASAIPEPVAGGLLCVGLAALGFVRSRQRAA
jgi:hypothetical protein